MYIFHNQEEQNAIFVFAAHAPRESRIIAFHDLAEMAYCKLNLKEIFGIATENFSAKMRSYDFIHIENEIFEK